MNDKLSFLEFLFIKWELLRVQRYLLKNYKLKCPNTTRKHMFLYQKQRGFLKIIQHYLTKPITKQYTISFFPETLKKGKCSYDCSFNIPLTKGVPMYYRLMKQPGILVSITKKAGVLKVSQFSTVQRQRGNECPYYVR